MKNSCLKSISITFDIFSFCILKKRFHLNYVLLKLMQLCCRFFQSKFNSKVAVEQIEAAVFAAQDTGLILL